MSDACIDYSARLSQCQVVTVELLASSRGLFIKKSGESNLIFRFADLMVGSFPNLEKKSLLGNLHLIIEACIKD